MYFILFFIIFSLSQYFTNSVLDINEDNKLSYTFDKREGLAIFSIFLVGVVLNIMNIYHILALSIYALSTVIICVVVMAARKIRVEKTKEETQLVYDVLQKLVDKKGVGLDFNNIPFELGYKYGKINKIHVTIDPTAFDDKQLPLFIDQLNNFLPTYTWQYELKLEKRLISFVGKDKPPTMVRWPGSWLQDFRAFPVGVSGDGEVVIRSENIPVSKIGPSQYKDERGQSIEIKDDLPYQPHSLICGATGGGKAVWIEQELRDI